MAHRYTRVEIRGAGGWKKGRGLWASVAPGGFIYISRGPAGRSYWMLGKLPRAERPRVRLVDSTATLWVNTIGVRFERPADYRRAAAALRGWAALTGGRRAGRSS